MVGPAGVVQGQVTTYQGNCVIDPKPQIQLQRRLYRLFRVIQTHPGLMAAVYRPMGCRFPLPGEQDFQRLAVCPTNAQLVLHPGAMVTPDLPAVILQADLNAWPGPPGRAF